MEQSEFYKKRLGLINDLEAQLEKDSFIKEREGLSKMVLNAITLYTFENRKTKKGTIAHVVVDTDYTPEELATRLILFDKSL